jgi:hypothetical protein
MSSIRRLYYYIVSLVTMSIMSAGAGTLLHLIFNLAIGGDRSGLPANYIQQQLSLGLAELIIGTPLWLMFWLNIQRQVKGKTSEIGAAMRQIYLNLILLVTAVLSLFMASNVLKWLMDGANRLENASGSLAVLIVIGLLWYYHWRVARKEERPSAVSLTLRRWYIYIVSAWGLIWLSTGVVQVIFASAVYLSGGESTLIRGPLWTGSLQTFVTWILLGGLWWGYHWFWLAKGDTDSTLRQVYIYLLTITGGSVAGLVGMVVTVERFLAWGLKAANTSAADYFQFLGWTIPLIIISIGIVAYHQTVSQEESAGMRERLLSSKRVHLYILSFLGLGSLVAGALILLGILLKLPIDHSFPDWWKTQLALGIALLLVSLPLFWYYWGRVARLAGAGGVMEWRARSRRIYFYLIIVASILGLVGGMVSIIYQMLNGALTGGIGLKAFQQSIIGIQAVAASAPLLFYHWRWARLEQKKGAESGPGFKSVSLLGGAQSFKLVQQLQDRLGHKVRFLELQGTEGEGKQWSEDEVGKLISEIEASPFSQVMIMVQGEKFSVWPYQEK